MKFEYLRCQEGLLMNKTFEFLPKTTLIYSESNSCGKTTLLRLLLYSLGFKVPETKGIKFDNIYTELKFQIRNKSFILKRDDFRIPNLIQVHFNGQVKYFTLPDEQEDLFKYIFQIDNQDILSNLLGIFYIDQEKGWTLLNRGVVIGKNRFSIESFIRGLSGSTCKKEFEDLSRIKDEILQYTKIYKIAEIKENVSYEKSESILYNAESSIIDKLQSLKLEKSSYTSEVKELKSLLRDNESTKELIDSMNLSISHGSEIIRIDSSNIIGLHDSIMFSRTKLQFLQKKIHELDDEIIRIENFLPKQDELISEEKSVLNVFIEKLSNINISSTQVKSVLEYLKKEKKSLENRINKITKSNEYIINEIYNDILKFSQQFNISNPLNKKKIDLFTKDLKSYSGAELHKLVLSYRFAYINAIKRHFDIILPIIIDSPTSKEVDTSNVNKMFEIIEQDFSDHQVIIASIYKYNINDSEIIKLNKSMFDA